MRFRIVEFTDGSFAAQVAFLLIDWGSIDREDLEVWSNCFSHKYCSVKSKKAAMDILKRYYKKLKDNNIKSIKIHKVSIKDLEYFYGR